MLKSSIINSGSYQAYLRNSFKSYRALIFLIPLGLFLLLDLFQSEIAALIRSLYPLSADHGFAYYLDVVSLVSSEILWWAFFALLTCILVIYPSSGRFENVFKLGTKSCNSHLVILILFTFFVTTLYVSYNTLEYFPVSSNEYAYLFQAEMFSRGKYWEPAHDLPSFFYVHNLVQYDGILVSRFPPGWPLFLSVAFEIGIPPFIVNPVLGVFTLVVFYFFSRHIYGDRIAIWSLLALAFTGYYIFNSASFFSHVSCLLVTLLFVFTLSVYNKNGNRLFVLMAGFFLGLAFMIRHYTALWVFVPFFFYMIYQYRLKSVHLFLLMAIGALPSFLFLLSYNYSITGNRFLPVHFWAYSDEVLGFVNGHTLFNGIVHVIRWILLFFYWCSPGLFILYVIYIYRKMKSGTERFLRPEEYIVLSLMLGHFFYYDFGGSQYGPRFLFEGFPFLILFVISRVFQAREKWAVALLIASLIYAVVKFPVIADREGSIVDERKDLYDLVNEQKIIDAVVLISSPTSPTRPMAVGELTRNDARFVNNVIYAIELPEITGQLMEYYSNRSFYKYVREPDKAHGELVRIK